MVSLNEQIYSHNTNNDKKDFRYTSSPSYIQTHPFTGRNDTHDPSIWCSRTWFTRKSYLLHVTFTQIYVIRYLRSQRDSWGKMVTHSFDSNTSTFHSFQLLDETKKKFQYEHLTLTLTLCKIFDSVVSWF